MEEITGKLECAYTPPYWRAAARKVRAALPKGSRTIKAPALDMLGPHVKQRQHGHIVLIEAYDIQRDLIRGSAWLYYTTRKKKAKAKR